MRPLGEVLADDGDLTIRRLRRAHEWQKQNGGTIEAALLATGALTEEVLTSALSRASGLPPVERQRVLRAEPAVVETLPAEARRRLRAIPFDWCGVRLSVAVSDPENTVLETGLVVATGYDVELHAMPDPVLEECLAAWERRGEAAPELVALDDSAPDGEPSDRLGRSLLGDAVRHEALAMEIGSDALSATARTLHFKVPPMLRRFDARLLAPLLGWFFARAGLEGSFAVRAADGSPLRQVVVEKTPGGLTLHFRDAPEERDAVPATRGCCATFAGPGDVFCPACGAAV